MWGARARAGQGKPLTVRFAHSPGFSGMVYPTWCGRGELKVFGQAFYKKLAERETASRGLEFLRKQRRKGEKSPSGTFLGGGLRCRVGRWSPVATGQRRPKRELRPVAGRVPPARSDPSPGGAGRRWRPFSADRAGRRDLPSEPKVRSRIYQAFPVPPPKARAALWRQRRRWGTVSATHPLPLPRLYLEGICTLCGAGGGESYIV